MLRRPVWVAWLLALPAALAAQQSTRYLPLDDPLMPAVEHLIRAGVIQDPDPLTRPFREAAVLRAAQKADTSTAPENLRSMVRLIVRKLTPQVDGPRVDLFFFTGPSAGTHARRDPLRPGGPKYFSGLLGMKISATMGPLVLSSEPFFDRRLRRDPDYPGYKDQPLSFRFTNAYLSFESRFAQLSYGSIERNWGPSGIEGLLVSPAPYSYDHFYARLGTTGFRVESELAQLNDTLNVFGILEHRWWVSHRFVFRPFPWMTGVLGQATLWKGGGPFEQSWFLSPTRLAAFAREDDNLADSANTLLSGDLWLRLPHGVVVQAQGLIDDMSLFHAKTFPNRLAGTLVVDVPVRDGASVRGLWTLVSSLAYRTLEGPIMYIMRHGTGLARNYDDYSQWTLSASLSPHRQFIVSPEITLLLQGEGDIRKPMPTWPNPTYPFLLVGTVERTLRLGMGAKMLEWRGFSVNSNAGVHFVSNVGNVAGASATRFVGSITVLYEFGSQFRAP